VSETKKVSRFVRPEVVRLSLSGGDWLDVRRELSVGESRAAMARTVKSIRADGRFEPDLEEIGKAEIAAYVIDWSSDRRVPYSAAALDSLTIETFNEIESAVKAHIAAVDAERGKSTSGSSSS
jgi:hypothetical protein